MSAKVVLTALHGLEPGRSFSFDMPARCVLGRSKDCDLHVPDDRLHLTVSRHHCLLTIDPPSVWVSDLDSRNGTFINTVNIGSRKTAATADPDRPGIFPLEDGDAIQAGNVLLTVHVYQDGENDLVNQTRKRA
jgi:pSer/pThr/pTyr-binding forkhead associated (FHA) protein